MSTRTPVVLAVDDGVLTVVVPACATRHHTITGSDTSTGYGEIEYMTGRARLWELFRRRTWQFSAQGRAATGLEALDRSADYWTAELRDPLDPEGTPLIVKVVPFTPVETYNQPSAQHTFNLTLRETLS